MKTAVKFAALFAIGGLIYGGIEVLWRGTSHRSMLAVGGVCFILMGLINEKLHWTTPLELQCLIAGGLITAVEFAAGCVVNLWLHWNIWDYSHQPLHLLGQVCLPYAGLWCVLSAVGILLDDVIRWLFFEQDEPVYKLFGRTFCIHRRSTWPL